MRVYEDLHGLDKDIDPTTYMNIKRLQLPGHLVRMFENRNQNVILEESLGGRFPARKPRNRWEDQMQKNVAIFFYTKR